MSTGITRGGGGVGSTGSSRGTSTGGGTPRSDGDIDIPLDAALTALDDAVKALQYARWALGDHESIDPDLARKCEEAQLLAESIASATVGDAV